MKYLYLTLLVLSILACQQKPKKTTSPKEKIEIPERLLGKDWEGNEILEGKVTYLQMASYTKEWFDKEYAAYPINQSLINKLKPLLEGKEVILYMGTWCEDSQREVPAMMKILRQADYNINDLKIIAVNEDKTTPDQLEKEHQITYVPALIFLEKGEEINRIVEFPIKTLEEDIFDILTGETYKNAYAE